MTLINTAEYRVSARGFNAVKKICSKITNQDSRRRAFKALLCMDTLADYLYSQGFDIDISKNLYKILPLNEEFEFTDIHCNGRFINVVPVVNGQYVLIPKNHIIFDVVPELYVVADYNQTTKKVKFLGCFEGNKIPKNVENGKYYVCDIKDIQPPAVIEELLSSVKNVEISESSHGIFVSFFIDYLDGVLDDTSKKRLITHLIECKDCRSELVEFFDYEAIAKETKKYPELFADNTLDIVGAVAVNDPKYKDFQEYTISIEKQKDEYEEDEEDVDGKQIKSAIEDPLQILYGKDKNKKIFDLMGDRPKKSSSMLDSVMSDITREARETRKIQNTEQFTPEEMNVSYNGAINPEYYAENLPEGTDIDESSQSDILHLDFDKIPMPMQKNATSEKPSIQQTTPIIQQEENLIKENLTAEENFVAEEFDDNIYEIVEENEEITDISNDKENDVIELVDNTEEDEQQPVKETTIPYSLKSDVDKPEFTARLNAQNDTSLTVSDEILLLDDEQNVDTPEFVNNMTQNKTEKQNDEEEADFISIEDEDSSIFDILKSAKDENALPTALDGIEYYENIEDETSKNNDDDNETDFLKEEKSEDIIKILDDFNDTSHLKINPPAEKENEGEDLHSFENDTTIEISPVESENTSIIDDIPTVSNSTENNNDLIIFSDNLPQKDITTNTKEIVVNEDIEEIQEYELIHFDAVDIDIVDEKDMQQFNYSVIPATIEEAGIAASSLIDDYEDSVSSETTNHLLSDNTQKNTNSVITSKTDEDLEDNLIIIDEDEETNDIQSVSIPLPTEEDDDLVVINDDEQEETFLNSFDTNKNTNSVITSKTDEDLEDNLIIIDEDEETNDIQSVSIPLPTEEDDDLVVINDDEQEETFLNSFDTNKNTNSVMQNKIDEDLGDDLVIIGEDEGTNDIQSVSIPLSTEEDDDFVVINDDEEEETFLNSFDTSKNTNSVIQNKIDEDLGDDLVIIGEDEGTNDIQSVSIPLSTEEDDDFVVINDDEEKETFLNSFDTSKNTNSVIQNKIDEDLGDDLVIIDEDEETNDIQSVSIPLSAEEDNDLVVINDDNPAVMPSNKNQEDISEIDNIEEEKLNINMDDIDDDLLLGLPTIAKEEKKEPTPVAKEENLLDEDDFLEFGNEDESDLLSFGDSQDFLLSDDEDDSFLIGEESEPHLQEEEISSINSDIENEPLVTADDKKESQSLSISSEDEEDEDDELIVIDDNETFLNSTSDIMEKGKKKEETKAEKASDTGNYDKSINFFRPAGANFDDDDLVVIKSEDEDSALTEENTNSVNEDDNLIVIEDESVQLDESLLIERPEQTEEQIEQNEETEEIVEEKETTNNSQQPQKPVSQLDLIFNSLSSREREQIDAVQSGKVKEDKPVEEEKEKTPQPQSTSKPVFRDIKDAISTKEKAVEEGRISLQESNEPVVDPLINTTVEKINEDDYEYEEVLVEDKEKGTEEPSEQKKETVEEVEYVYEDENGEEYIPEEGEEVEYVYEDENGNIISDEEVTVEEDEDVDIIDEPTENNTTTKDEDGVEEFEDISEDSEDIEQTDISKEEDRRTSSPQKEYEEDELSFNNKVEDDFVSQDFDDRDDEISDFEENIKIDQNDIQDLENDEEPEEDIDDESLDEETNTAKDNKKAIIKKTAIAAAVVLVLAGAGIAAKMFLTNTNAQAEQQALNEGIAAGENIPSEEENGLSIPDEHATNNAISPTGDSSNIIGSSEEEDEAGGLSIPESDEEAVLGGEAPKSTPVQEPIGPKAGTSNATTSDMNKAVANAFSEAPSSFSVSKASWGVGATLAADADFKAYLQKMGKIIKSDLRKNLASVKGEAPISPVKIQIKLSDTGVLQDTVIIKSSGKPEIDEVVLQSVKQTAAACPFPELSENTLKANKEATGSNTVKMSLTVTF